MTDGRELFSVLAEAGGMALNVEATSLEAARATLGRSVPVLVGVMMRRFPTVEEGVTAVSRLLEAGVHVSIGLGDGAADQWERALQAAEATGPLHLNQVFPAAAASQRVLRDAGLPTVVNALVRPAGVGLLDLATGPVSGGADARAVVPVAIALDMLLEMGVRSIKVFPVGGLERLDELMAVASAAAARGMLVEPTGGLSPEHLPTLLASFRAVGCSVMPHLYGSLKDGATGDLSAERLAVAVEAMERVREAR
jgi:2-dehydro-3-deoxy-phosphogluconate aldolase